MVEVIFSRKARDVLSQLKREKGSLYILLGDTGCCGFSNVFITSLEPSGDYVYLGFEDGAKIYLQRRLMASQKLHIDVITSEIDDSFSAETSMRCRFILRRR
ncbi:MAG: hypothetical protein QW756_01860 [Nitrososphaerota archaeon]